MALQVVYAPQLSVLQQYGIAPLPQLLLWFTVVGVGRGLCVFLGGVHSGGGLGGLGAGAATALVAKRIARAKTWVYCILTSLMIVLWKVKKYGVDYDSCACCRG